MCCATVVSLRVQGILDRYRSKGDASHLYFLAKLQPIVDLGSKAALNKYLKFEHGARKSLIRRALKT